MGIQEEEEEIEDNGYFWALLGCLLSVKKQSTNYWKLKSPEKGGNLWKIFLQLCNRNYICKECEEQPDPICNEYHYIIAIQFKGLFMTCSAAYLGFSSIKAWTWSSLVIWRIKKKKHQHLGSYNFEGPNKQTSKKTLCKLLLFIQSSSRHSGMGVRKRKTTDPMCKEGG